LADDLSNESRGKLDSDRALLKALEEGSTGKEKLPPRAPSGRPGARAGEEERRARTEELRLRATLTKRLGSAAAALQGRGGGR